MIIEIQPGSPAWRHVARAIDTGRKISIEPREGGVAVKIGEDIWTLALPTDPTPHVDTNLCDHYRLRELTRVIDRDAVHAHGLKVYGPGGEHTRTLSLSAAEVTALAAMLDRADNR